MSRRNPPKVVNDPAKRETFLYGLLRLSWERFKLRLCFIFLLFCGLALWMTLEDIVYDKNQERWEQERLALEQERLALEQENLALEQQFFASPEWAAFIGSRVEWTDAHEAAVSPEEADLAWEGDPFYLAPEAYYRITDTSLEYSNIKSTLLEIISRSNNEVVLGMSGVTYLFICEVEFSDLSCWRCIGTANRKKELLEVDYEFYPFAQDIYYSDLSEDEELQTYLKERAEELSKSDRWLKTIGNDYRITEPPSPDFAYLSSDANTIDVTYMGYACEAQAGNTDWMVNISVKYDRQAKEYYELPVSIIPW